jgi:hypothetical protein
MLSRQSCTKQNAAIALPSQPARTMPIDNLHHLRQAGAAADVPSFLRLVTNKACATLFSNNHNGDDFRRLQRQGYSAVVLAALSKGLQLYNNAAVASALQGSFTGSAFRIDVSKDTQQLLDWVGFLALSSVQNVHSCAFYWGEGSQEVKNMEQELLESGVHALLRVCHSLGRPR